MGCFELPAVAVKPAPTREPKGEKVGWENRDAECAESAAEQLLELVLNTLTAAERHGRWHKLRTTD
jgi:hypothetical protein